MAEANTDSTPVGEMRLTGEAKVLWDALLTAKLFNEDTFDTNVREKLSSLDEHLAVDTLQRYRDANTSGIRNHNRYLLAIISRVVEAHERLGGGLDHVELDPVVVEALDSLILEKNIEDGE
jgi:hypothetical protein